MEDLGRSRLRSAERPARRGPRHLDRGSKIVAEPTDARRPCHACSGCRGHGRHARRRRHALPHCRPEGQHGPQDASRGPASGAARDAHGQDAKRHDGQCSQYVCHGLQVCRAWDTRPPSMRPSRPSPAPRPRGVRRHPLHRQGVLCLDGQQPLHHAGLAAKEPDKVQVLHRLVAERHQRLRRQTRQSRRSRGLETARGRQRALGGSDHRRLWRDAAADRARRGRSGR